MKRNKLLTIKKLCSNDLINKFCLKSIFFTPRLEQIEIKLNIEHFLSQIDLDPLEKKENSEKFGSFVGSYEESILIGRVSTSPSKPITFLASIGALATGRCKASLKCPPHLNLKFPAYFYNLNGSAGLCPYVATIELKGSESFGKLGYRLPSEGQIQIV